MKKSMHYGATQEEWDLFDFILGYTTELLPVVSNPNAEISEKSNIKKLGKVPSIYNREGKVAGYPSWTEFKATLQHVVKWRKQKDYGICMQTRYVRCIDVDIKDAALAKRVRDFIYARHKFPMRWRADSSKFLVAFIVEGDIQKTVVRVDDLPKGGDIIEFLANGQQFICAGTHQDGERYQWNWHGCDDFPVLTLEQYNELRDAIAAEFGVTVTSIKVGARNAKTDVVKAEADDVVDFLYKHGLTLGEGRDGSVYFDCPWKDGHSSDNGPSQTAYFPPGRGYARGKFKCLHAGCAVHNDDQTDFLIQLGINEDMFEEIPQLPPPKSATGKQLAPLNFRRSDNQTKRGTSMIYPELENLMQALARPELCGFHIRYDTFEGQLMFAPADNPTGWEVMTDDHVTEMRFKLETKAFGSIGRELMRDALGLHGKYNSFDSAQEWLYNVVPEWDGVERIAVFFPEYAKTEDSPYTRAVSNYMWTALAGRVLQPGVKADMVPVMVGPQGVGKSMLVASLVPWPTMAGTFTLKNRDNDLARMMRAKLIAELPELAGMRSREREDVKMFISLEYDAWIEKYQVGETKRLRRLIFVGTTNEDEFLDDPTGERRWLPIRLVTEMGIEGIRRIRNDREQLWAEARDKFLENGVDWSAQQLAKKEHKDFRRVDPWETAIEEWMDITQEIDGGDVVTPRQRGYVTSTEVAEQAIGLMAKNCNAGTHMRVTSCLKHMGWTKHDGMIEGHKGKLWISPAKLCELKGNSSTSSTTPPPRLLR